MASGGEELETEEVEAQEFNFDTWATSLKLSRKVTQSLRTEELCTKEALILLEAKDLKEIGLPIGAVKIIMHWVRKCISSDNSTNVMTPAYSGGATTGSNPASSEDILTASGKTLDTLLGGITVGSRVDTVPSHMDPRTILTIKSSSSKTVHITQFLTEKCKRRRMKNRQEFVLRSGQPNADTMILKTEDEHPYLGIYIEEWGAANMRLLNFLISSGQLKRQDIEFYLAYTTKIFEFAEKHEWSSVLNFDHTYRERQAEHGFQWGTFSPHMELQMLVPKNKKPFNIQHASNGQHANFGQENCKIFMTKGSCPFEENCRYRHPKTFVRRPPRSGYTVPKNE